MSTVKVRSDVPLPPPKAGKSSAHAESNAKLLALMAQKGCSVELDPRHASSFMAFAKAKAMKAKFVARRLSDTVVGVWRVE